MACAGVTLKAVSTALDLPLRNAVVRAEGELDFRGTLGVDREAPVGFRAIRLTFDARHRRAAGAGRQGDQADRALLRRLPDAEPEARADGHDDAGLRRSGGAVRGLKVARVLVRTGPWSRTKVAVMGSPFRRVGTLIACAAVATAASCATLPPCPAKGGPAWRELASAHVLMRTDLDEADAQETIQAFEELRAAMFAVMWPGASPPPNPIQVVALRIGRRARGLHADAAGLGHAGVSAAFRVDHRDRGRDEQSQPLEGRPRAGA